MQENTTVNNPDEQFKTTVKQPALSNDQVLKWLSRAKTASKFHRKEFLPKYRQAKRRYNSEIGYAGINYSQNATRAKANHTDINLLFKDVKNFISSIFYRNPKVELSSRIDDEQTKSNIQNLAQSVNDDIQDREKELKALLRSCLVDESLSGVGAVYIDYDYHDKMVTDETGNPVEVLPGVPQMDQVRNEVTIVKIKPENIIRPPYCYYYNYKTSPYLGYVDIMSLESLKNNSSLDQSVVARIKGQEYRSLIDFDIKELDKSNIEDKDDILHAKIYTIFIKGSDNAPIKRLVVSDDDETRGEFLAYDDYDKGHGKDDRGYPIHILELNDASDTFVPPSEAWILEPVLQVIDHIYAKMNRHLKKASTRTFIKTGDGGIEKEEMDKLIRNNDLEYIGIKNLPPGVDVGSITNQVTDQALSQDHDAMLGMARQIFDDLSRQPSFTQPSVINKKKTATESNALQQTDSTQNADYIDKFKDFLCDLFYDWAKLIQRNFQGAKDITVTDPISGEKQVRPNITSENLQGEFRADINVTSFLQPNKEVKRQTLKETINDLMLFQPFLREQGLKVNAKKATEELLENVEVRNPSAMVVSVPVRTIDQQVTDSVFHNVPMNPQDLGDDAQKALERLMQIFQDDAQMGAYEQIKPGIGQEGGEIVQMLRFLESVISGQAPAKPKPSVAKTDVGMGAAQMGAAA